MKKNHYYFPPPTASSRFAAGLTGFCSDFIVSPVGIATSRVYACLNEFPKPEEFPVLFHLAVIAASQSVEELLSPLLQPDY